VRLVITLCMSEAMIVPIGDGGLLTAYRTFKLCTELTHSIAGPYHDASSAGAQQACYFRTNIAKDRISSARCTIAPFSSLKYPDMQKPADGAVCVSGSEQPRRVLSG